MHALGNEYLHDEPEDEETRTLLHPIPPPEAQVGRAQGGGTHRVPTTRQHDNILVLVCHKDAVPGNARLGIWVLKHSGVDDES